MSSDQYIKSILKKTRCSKRKQKEIRAQLKSDIQIAIENGERFDEIILRMGTPEEVAKEFNDYFPAEEGKAAKREKRTKILAAVGGVLVAFALVLYWWWPKANEVGQYEVFSKEVVESQTEMLIQQFNQENYDVLVQNSDKNLSGLLTAEVLQTARNQISQEWGAFLSFGKVYMQEVEQMGKKTVVLQMNASYENVSVTYTFQYNEEMQIMSFYIK